MAQNVIDERVSLAFNASDPDVLGDLQALSKKGGANWYKVIVLQLFSGLNLLTIKGIFRIIMLGLSGVPQADPVGFYSTRKKERHL